MHMQLRKIVKNRGHFPSDEAASKLLYLALRNIEKDWKMPPITWRQAVNQFAILFGERFTTPSAETFNRPQHTKYLTPPPALTMYFRPAAAASNRRQRSGR
jgi:hypothetical protein